MEKRQWHSADDPELLKLLSDINSLIATTKKQREALEYLESQAWRPSGMVLPSA